MDKLEIPRRSGKDNQRSYFKNSGFEPIQVQLQYSNGRDTSSRVGEAQGF